MGPTQADTLSSVAAAAIAKAKRAIKPGTSVNRPVPSSAAGFVDEKALQRLEHLVSAHVDSFDYFLESGMRAAVSDLLPIEFGLGEESMYVRAFVTQLSVGAPNKADDYAEAKMTPREARERQLSYSGAMTCNMQVQVMLGDSVINDHSFTVKLGQMPIMVMSSKCHLRGFNPRKLAQAGEEATEVGGYFILNGIERVIRLLQVPRRNHALAIERSSYKNRGPLYSEKGVAMRCVRPDQSSITVTLHYLNNGGATVKFVLRKQEFLIPIIIIARALCDITDKELSERVLLGDVSNTFVSTRMELLLRDAKQYGLESQRACLAYLGYHFRAFLPISSRTTDEDAGRLLVQRYLFVHVEEFSAKFECLLHMLRKLFCFAQGKCAPDNADVFMNHELLLPGHLTTMIMKERLEEMLIGMKAAVVKDFNINKTKCMADMAGSRYFLRHAERSGGSTGPKFGSFLSTGNLVTSTGLDLQQVSGYTIVAERLNIFRYLSHFQSVHRGQFFTTMKTTTVRKLFPESWGFLCPVHTPDGAPCGLLNHLAKEAVIMAYPSSERLPITPQGRLVSPGSDPTPGNWLSGQELRNLFVSLGVVPGGRSFADGEVALSSSSAGSAVSDVMLPVLLDGIVLGVVPSSRAPLVVAQLRQLKVNGGVEGVPNTRLDPTMELAYIPLPTIGTKTASSGGAYPGLYIFTHPGRMIRPVLHLGTRKIEWIGPMEQVFMDIACLAEDVRPGETTHMETRPDVMLSHVAYLTPYSDCNQSPRNMYQCQMGKQTMGTPAHALPHRTDNKLFRIQNPQAPIVQTQGQSEFMMDEYPQGTNAVVAVISYTGYDMEDAMIINKSSYERGFGHGSVYKTKIIDLDEEEKHTENGVKPTLRFFNVKSVKGPKGSEEVEKFFDSLDVDGLPREGDVIKPGEPLCAMVDEVTGNHRCIKHKENEQAFVDTVRVISAGSDNSKRGSQLRRVSITLRFKRNPIIGDKFSSRHGQKGTLSVLWPQHDMPFTESGMTPDVLINPHAYPSRMTIGMLIESMAGKSGSLNGFFQDASPFQFHEENRAIDYIGEQLKASGYHYYGSEPLYSGVSGTVLNADIFIGVVYYQRLRHMVSDKSQVRATGPVMAVTRQPVKGRKKHGGIRLGEMERDALLSHGVAFCVHDRLMNCSDIHVAYVCGDCGSFLDVYSSVAGKKGEVVASSAGGKRTGGAGAGAGGGGKQRRQVCHRCNRSSSVRAVYLPYIFRFLSNELAGMGIHLALGLRS